jgi:threonine dehydrogenase-like Zn-dependent dehydrogenase
MKFVSAYPTHRSIQAISWESWGSPAFGTPPTISAAGRVPGLEGAGVVSEVGAHIDASRGLRPGLRVAFFPAPGSWRDEVVVPAGSVVPLPDSIPDEIGAQMLINTATALTAIRTAHDSLPPDVAAGFDMSAVLDIVVGPIVFSRSIVTPVEERVKCFEGKHLVLFL